jgi:hypothetical protein
MSTYPWKKLNRLEKKVKKSEIDIKHIEAQISDMVHLETTLIDVMNKLIKNDKPHAKSNVYPDILGYIGVLLCIVLFIMYRDKIPYELGSNFPKLGDHFID